MHHFPELKYPFDWSKRLTDFSTNYTAGIKDKALARRVLEKEREKLFNLQHTLFSDGRYSLLIILQAMDGAGKDSTIRHVMSGINPVGCLVKSFKAPSDEELRHDFLWRCSKELPEKGDIGVFNRSYYEDVLIVRVHPEMLHNYPFPPSTVKKPDNEFWKKRFNNIVNFEKHLHHENTHVLKFFLHISKEEQKNRFIKRIEDPRKNWKFQYADLREREYWDEYMHAYDEMLRHTSTKMAPWYVIPADNKWFMQMAVGCIINRKLKSMKLKIPLASEHHKEELENAMLILSGKAKYSDFENNL
jgi:PPK2 family polyphosphate:nucleotide phosphotransferase